MDRKAQVSRLSKAELIEVITWLAEQDEDIEKKLEFKLSTSNDDIKASKKLVREYINRYKNKGFIMWRNVNNSLQGAEMVIEKGREKLGNQQEETAVELGITVLSIVVDMLQYSDDSGGGVGDVIHESISLIDDASCQGLATGNSQLQRNMYQKIMKEAMHKRYNGWTDWRYDLIKVCTIFSRDVSIRKKLEKQLDQLLEGISSTSISADYETRDVKQLQLEILEVNGETKRAEQFIYDNIQDSSFREKAIEKRLEIGNYEAVIKLCKDGEKVDGKYPGRVKRWRKYQLQAYEALGDRVKQRELLLEFVYGDEYEAYEKLKKLYSREEWEKVVAKIFNMFEQEVRFRPIYAKIAKTEERTDKLLYYCKQHPYSIQEMYPHLRGYYQNEMDEIFTTYIKNQAETATNRKKYRSVCRIINEYKKACGHTKFQKLVDELKETYQTKPAFVDELEKLWGDAGTGTSSQGIEE